MNSVRPHSHCQVGMVQILSLFLITVIATLALVAGSTGFLNLRQSENLRATVDARLASESGLEFALYCLRDVRLSSDTTESTFLPQLCNALAPQLNGTANLAGQAVLNTGQSVSIPSVQYADHKSFAGWLTWAGDNLCLLKVEGSSRNASRSLTIELDLVPRLAEAFDYGLASRGQINISGSATIIGSNNPEEASVFSAAESEAQAITVSGGGVEISGDLYVSGDSTSMSIGGGPSIGGSDDPEEIEQHLHFGVDPPDFPELDTTALAALADTVVDGSTVIPSGAVLNNIRIAAGTNPTFNNDITLNGVIYIEAPNKVTFSGHAAVNGIIVTEDSDEPLTNCQLTFAGTMDSSGVDSLPDTEEFAAVKQHKGTFLLAPGFSVKFSGTFGTINGTIAADQMTWSGTSQGNIVGAVIGLEDLPLNIGGNVSIRVDRSNMEDNPAGFVRSLALEPQIDSYTELVTQ